MPKKQSKRSKEKQSEHDKAVERRAKELKRQGYEVQADLPGWEQPKPIGKDRRIPDYVAINKRTKKTVVIGEVETRETMHRDKDQHSTFRRSAAQRGARFELLLADEKKRKTSRKARKPTTRSRKRS